jgi:N6-L-threonylcarbamoyladenine synthase
MPLYLGIDTSNYTTSAAVYNFDTGDIIQEKFLLPVKNGELGLRQSDAVFHHTHQLPVVIGRLFSGINKEIAAIGVSTRPRNADGSYMPCFTCGEGFADSLSAILKKPVYKTSHQVGHVLAALYSANKIELIKERFIAFHVSGGTTDCLLIEPDKDEVIKASEFGTSLDLKAGQAIDRAGVMLGLEFPCGKELEKLAEKSKQSYNVKPVMKGRSCCLSGIENQCRKMLDNKAEPCDIAKFCITSVYAAVRAMTEAALKEYEGLPVVYAGGVMSNRFIRENICREFKAFFAESEFSCDNAAGTALFTAVKENGLL